MIFSSLTFLWIFLPFALLVNYLLSLVKKEELKMLLKNICLLILSLVFYAGGGIRYVLIMVASILGNYIFARVITHCRAKQKLKTTKTLFIFALIFNIGLLVFFKYTTFLLEIFQSITSLQFDVIQIVLPVGISFFTFQAISYVVDVYREKIDCQKNIIKLALYISFFPQLIAGPIIKYTEIKKQIDNREESVELIFEGIKKFLYGLAKKVIIANMMGEVTKTIFFNPIETLGSGTVWLAVICYTLQIYYDFSGYSDMAIGLGKMFGFKFSENFNYPYLATSITDFWRRWHISLSRWFRDYVYIPCGGNRKGLFRTCINILIVFLLTGIWHGANYTFIVWGVAYGVFLLLEKLFLGKLLEKNKFKPLNVLYTLFIVVLLWVFFQAENLSSAWQTITVMFSFRSGTYPMFQAISLQQWLVMALGILFCGPMQLLFTPLWKKIKDKTATIWVDYIFQFCLYFICINLLINSSFNPFIYFQF